MTEPEAIPEIKIAFDKNIYNIDHFMKQGFEIPETGRLGNHRTIQLIILSEPKEIQEIAAELRSKKL